MDVPPSRHTWNNECTNMYEILIYNSVVFSYLIIYAFIDIFNVEMVWIKYVGGQTKLTDNSKTRYRNSWLRNVLDKIMKAFFEVKKHLFLFFFFFYLFIHSVTLVTLDMSITDYNLYITT